MHLTDSVGSFIYIRACPLYKVDHIVISENISYMGGKELLIAIVLLMYRVYVNAKLVILTDLSLYTANTSIPTFLPTQNTGPTAQIPI